VIKRDEGKKAIEMCDCCDCSAKRRGYYGGFWCEETGIPIMSECRYNEPVGTCELKALEVRGCSEGLSKELEILHM